MPILPLEPAVYPECLFDDIPPLETSERRWWVLHTRPRQEKRLAQQLRDKEIPFFLPLVPHQLRIRTRDFCSHLPLFPGYVFLLGTRHERIAALSSGRVVHPLEVHDQARLWGDLRQVNRLIASGAPVTPEGHLVPGTPVEIRSGPLAGLRGTILQAVSGRRFLVRVDFIQRGASVLLDDVWLVKVFD
jgi:transcriptional antiterminator RfaH